MSDDGEEDAADDADAAPLDDLAREVRARREADADEEIPEADLSETDLFESVEVADIDSEAVWESFVEGELGPDEEVGLGADVEAVDDAGADEHIVPKRDFCQRCPHFTDPPDVACTHEGTTIVEVVDSDHFRVRNCPVVETEPGASPVDR